MKRTGAIICKHVSYPESPIRYAARGVPLEPTDSGWQFLCGLQIAHQSNDAAVWLLEEVAALDPTLREILDAEPKKCFERSSGVAHWNEVPYERDEL
jgi:hypothetical protein